MFRSDNVTIVIVRVYMPLEYPICFTACAAGRLAEETDRIWALYGVFSAEILLKLALLVDYGEAARS